jgi:multimeric flavodoxin WrbA
LKVSVLVILGSARGESHTRALLDAVVAGRPHSEFDLRDLDIGHFTYGGAVERDGFGRVAEAMADHTRILFATPVYWYSMSGRMKVLFDRFTDLVTVRKDIGRRLKGRTLFVLACGTDRELPSGFEVPFQETARYLDMGYGGACYGQTNEDGPLKSALRDAAAFGDTLFS